MVISDSEHFCRFLLRFELTSEKNRNQIIWFVFHSKIYYIFLKYEEYLRSYQICWDYNSWNAKIIFEVIARNEIKFYQKCQKYHSYNRNVTQIDLFTEVLEVILNENIQWMAFSVLFFCCLRFQWMKQLKLQLFPINGCKSGPEPTLAFSKWIWFIRLRKLFIN